jgi:hypothetical protein
VKKLEGAMGQKTMTADDIRRTYINILELGQQPTLTTIIKLPKPLRLSAKDLVGLVETELHTANPHRR